MDELALLAKDHREARKNAIADKIFYSGGNGMYEHEEIERRREANEGAHPAEALYDEEGSFAVRAVFLDGVDRTQSLHRSLRGALLAADLYRAEMRRKGYGAGRLHVGVIDDNDPERGELDWDIVS